MENIQIKGNYQNSLSSNIANQLKKGGVFLNVQEASEIANKLEDSTKIEENSRAVESNHSIFLASVFKVLKKIKEGENIDSVFYDFGINLDEMILIGESVHMPKFYKKSKINKSENNYKSISTELYLTKDDSKASEEESRFMLDILRRKF